jgi:hypothetical protein
MPAVRALSSPNLPAGGIDRVPFAAARSQPLPDAAAVAHGETLAHRGALLVR